MKARNIVLVVLGFAAYIAVLVYALFHQGASADRGPQAAVAKPQTIAKAAQTAPTARQAASKTTREAGKQLAALTDSIGQPPKPGLGFDVARINPDGASVIAGRALPDQTVEIFADGILVGRVKADSEGNWVLIVEKKLASADPKLELRPAATRVASAGPQAATPEPTAAATRAPLRKAQITTAASHNAQMMAQLKDLVARAKRGEPGSTAKLDSKIAALGRSTEANGAKRPAEGTRGGSLAATGSLDGSQRSVTVVPVPIQFEFQEARFTQSGKKAADLLMEYIKARGLAAITLSGHADDRGTAAYNLELSKRRLESVQQFLREAGYRGKLALLPKGKTEPYQGVDRKALSKDDLFQVDRRVELRLSE